MEEYGTELHIPFDFKHFALFPRNPSVCGRVSVSLSVQDEYMLTNDEYIPSDCRYYKGGEEAPEDLDSSQVWEFERLYCAHAALEDSGHLLDTFMDRYSRAGLSGFANTDGTSFSLKAVLYGCYMRQNEGADAEDFKKWYLRHYPAR